MACTRGTDNVHVVTICLESAGPTLEPSVCCPLRVYKSSLWTYPLHWRRKTNSCVILQRNDWELGGGSQVREHRRRWRSPAKLTDMWPGVTLLNRGRRCWTLWPMIDWEKLRVTNVSLSACVHESDQYCDIPGVWTGQCWQIRGEYRYLLVPGTLNDADAAAAAGRLFIFSAQFVVS